MSLFAVLCWDSDSQPSAATFSDDSDAYYIVIQMNGPDWILAKVFLIIRIIHIIGA